MRTIAPIALIFFMRSPILPTHERARPPHCGRRSGVNATLGRPLATWHTAGAGVRPSASVPPVILNRHPRPKTGLTKPGCRDQSHDALAVAAPGLEQFKHPLLVVAPSRGCLGCRTRCRDTRIRCGCEQHGWPDKTSASGCAGSSHTTMAQVCTLPSFPRCIPIPMRVTRCISPETNPEVLALMEQVALADPRYGVVARVQPPVVRGVRAGAIEVV